MTRFAEFVHSPYHNKHEDVQRLVDYLSVIYPDFSEKNCNRQEIFQHLFPNKSHDQQQLAIVFTYTLRLFEQFLTQESLKKREDIVQLQLLHELRQRKAYDYYEKKLKPVRKWLQHYPWKDSEYHYLRFRLATESNNYYDQFSRHAEDPSIQYRQNHLDRFYLSEKLRDACEMQVRQNILKVDYSARLLDAAVLEVRNHLEEYQHVPAVIIYYQIYQMLTKDTWEAYTHALESLQACEYAFPVSELRAIYNYFQNYCIGKINQGNSPFLKALFELYQFQLDKELIFENGLLSEWHYKNIVTLGLRLNETDWVHEFIERYKTHLPPESYENAYTYNLASYYYAVGEFEKVRDLLIKVEYSDIQYLLGARALQIRTYFDIEEYEPLLSLIESFKQYLHRNKLLTDDRRQGFYNLMKYTKKAVRLKAEWEYTLDEKLIQRVNELQQEVQAIGNIINKGWLLEKLEAMQERLGNVKLGM